MTVAIVQARGMDHVAPSSKQSSVSTCFVASHSFLFYCSRFRERKHRVLNISFGFV